MSMGICDDFDLKTTLENTRTSLADGLSSKRKKYRYQGTVETLSVQNIIPNTDHLALIVTAKGHMKISFRP